MGQISDPSLATIFECFWCHHKTFKLQGHHIARIWGPWHPPKDSPHVTANAAQPPFAACLSPSSPDLCSQMGRFHGNPCKIPQKKKRSISVCPKGPWMFNSFLHIGLPDFVRNSWNNSTSQKKHGLLNRHGNVTKTQRNIIDFWSGPPVQQTNGFVWK